MSAALVMIERKVYPVFLFLAIFIVIGENAIAQDQSTRLQNYNSKKAVSNSFTKDTTYILALIRRGAIIKGKKNDSAELLFKVAVARSISISYPEGAAHALLHLSSDAFLYKNDIKAFKKYRQQAYFFIQQSSLRNGKARFLSKYYGDMAYPYQVMGKYDSGALCIHEALNVLDYYKESPHLKVPLYNNLAAFYNQTSQPDKALYYQKKAEQLISKWKNKEGLITIYSNMAMSYLDLGDTAKARLYCNKGIEMTKYYPDSRTLVSLSSLNRTLGQLSLRGLDPKQAIYYFNKALEASEEHYSFMGTARNYSSLAAAYEMLKDYQQQEHYLQKALAATNKKNQSGPVKLEVYTNLAKTYHHLGHFKEAYHYRVLSAQMQDSLLNKEKLAITNKLDIVYRSSEKDRDIIQKQLLLASRHAALRKKNYWIIGISGTSFFLIFLFAGVYRNYRQKQKTQIEKMNSLQKEKEIGNLKAVITGEERERTRLARDLHDGNMVLFSAVKMQLKTLPKHFRELKESSNFQEVTQQLDDAIKELRRAAHNLMPDMLLEGGLAEAVFYFCRTLQQNTGVSFIFQHYGEMPRLQEEFELSIYRIVQELLQNIIKHANASKAIIQLNYTGSTLCITVEDNGIGFVETNLHDHSGMGLKSIRTRTTALNGSIDIRSIKNKGTTVYLEFDIRSVIRSRSSEHQY